MPKLFAKTLSALTAGLCMISAVSLPPLISSSTVYAADFQEKGTVDGYYYEIWQQNYIGELNYENTENNGYSASWSGIENVFALKGEAFERKKTFASQLKEYNVTYDADIDYMGQNNFSGIYGWMEGEQLCYDFYIVDSWGSWRPVGNGYDANNYGSFESNGITYDIYRSIITQMSCFSDGSPIRYTYYSVARNNFAERINGTCNIKNTINVADHLRAWTEAGFELGYMYDVGFSAEGYRSSGSVKLNSLDISKEITEENNYGPKFEYTSHEPLPTDVNGRKVFIDFETETEDDRFGAAFDGTEASYDTDHSFSGERSMLISGDDKTTRSFQYRIDPYDFSSKELSAGLKLYQNSGKNVSFTFQVADINSTTGYLRNLYSRTIPSGIWTDVEDMDFMLSNSKFANEVIRIISDEPVNFCIDDFCLADSSDVRDNEVKKENPSRGDINRDGSIDIYDVVALRRLLLMTEEYNVNFYQDVNGDFKLNIGDLTALTQFVLGKTKQLPEPEKEYSYFTDDFSRTVGSTVFRANSFEYDAGEIKSAVCSDGSFSTQWSEKDWYELSNSQILKDLDKLDLKYSGTVNTQSCGKEGYESCVKMRITADFISDDNTVAFYIWDGESEAERLRWLESPDDMKLVEIGGNEYYIDKNEELPDVIDPDKSIWLYPKENSVKTDELCTFSGEIDFTEILKYFGMEDLKPYSVECSLVTEHTKGFAEFNEMICTDSSKAE